MVIEIEPEYKKLVDLVANKDLNLEISNSSINHSKYIIKRMIEKTKINMNVYAKNFNKEIFFDSEIIDTIKKKDNVNINFLLGQNNKDDILSLIKKTQNKNIKLKTKDINDDKTSFFIVSDKKRIRLQSLLDNLKSKANFNDNKLASRFDKIFYELWNNLNEVV